jgi:hypothetical protein
MVLRQCAHFYNTIGSAMVESQKPMMLADALEFEKARVASGLGAAVPGSQQGATAGLQPPRKSALAVRQRVGSRSRLSLASPPAQVLLAPRDAQGQEITWRSTAALSGYVRRLSEVGWGLGAVNVEQ